MLAPVQLTGSVQLVDVHWAVSSASAVVQSAQLAHVYVAPAVVLYSLAVHSPLALAVVHRS